MTRNGKKKMLTAGGSRSRNDKITGPDIGDILRCPVRIFLILGSDRRDEVWDFHRSGQFESRAHREAQVPHAPRTEVAAQPKPKVLFIRVWDYPNKQAAEIFRRRRSGAPRNPACEFVLYLEMDLLYLTNSAQRSHFQQKPVRQRSTEIFEKQRKNFNSVLFF